MSDFAAWQLSQIDGFPPLPLDGPLADRDSASETIAQFLRDRAADLRLENQGTIMKILESATPEFTASPSPFFGGGLYLFQPGSGTIAGTVTNFGGAPLAGATIDIRNMNTQATSKVTSSNTGKYSLTNLAPISHE